MLSPFQIPPTQREIYATSFYGQMAMARYPKATDQQISVACDVFFHSMRASRIQELPEIMREIYQKPFNN